MIQWVFLILGGLITTYLTYLVLKPLTELLLLKIKHGKDIHIEFFPILGDIFKFRKAIKVHKDVRYFSRQLIKKHPGVKIIASNFILDKILINIVDPQLIKQFLQAPELYRKDDMLLFNELVFSEGLLFTEDQPWKDQRKTIGQQFTFENLKCRIPIMKELTKNIFSKQIQEGQEIKIIEVISQITGQVITQTFFGEEFSQQLVNGLTVTDAVVECITMQINCSFRRLWTHFRGLFYGYKGIFPQFLLTAEEKIFLSKLKNFHNFVKAGIAKREEQYEENLKKGNQDFIQIYLADSSFIFTQNEEKNNRIPSKDELLHQFITFSFAGTDTTSTLSGMACYFLSQKQELQEQLRSHLKEQIKSFDEITHLDLTKLDKLNAFCLEVLRMYPPAGGIFPRKARQQHKIGNFTMKTHYLLGCAILPVQQNPKYYENPEEFNIDRWLNNELKEPHAFVPFSSGPRNCIGQHMALTEAKIILSYILLTYKVVPDPKRKIEMSAQSSLYAPKDDRLVLFYKL